MVLELSDQASIKTFTLEKPQKRWIFNEDEIITPQNWAMIDSQLRREGSPSLQPETNWTFSLWKDARDSYLALSVLKPDELDVCREKIDLQEAIDDINSWRSKDDEAFNSGFIERTAQLKLLYPKKIPELGVSDKVWEDLTKFLSEFDQERTSGIYFSSLVCNGKLLFPDKNWGPELSEKIRARLNFEIKSQQNKSLSVTTNAAVLKLFFPEQFNDQLISNTLYENTLAAIKREFSPYGSWPFGLIAAMSLKILAAEKAQITDEGIKLTMPRPSLVRNPEMPPEARKF